MSKNQTSDSFVPRYLIRDISWVDFNERVLEEGLRRDLKPLDRFKYLSIVSSNFDEYFMVRVAAIKIPIMFRYASCAALTKQQQHVAQNSSSLYIPG